MINAIAGACSAKELTNVKPVLRGVGSNPRLPARSLDAVLVVDASPTRMRRAASRCSRTWRARSSPRAASGVVDFKLEGTGAGPCAGRTRQSRRRGEGREGGGAAADPPGTVPADQVVSIFGKSAQTPAAPSNFQALGSTRPAATILITSTMMKG